VTGDVDEPALAGHRSALVAARPSLQRRAVGAVDDDRVEAEGRNAQASDRRPFGEGGAVPACEAADVGGLGAPRRRPGRLRGVAALELPELDGEAPLLPVRVARGERVAPAPDPERPDEQAEPDEDGELGRATREPATVRA